MSGSQSSNEIGALRLALWGAAAVCMPLVFLSDVEPEGIGILTAYIAPTLVVLFFFVLMLDALMNRVFMIDQAAQGKRPYRRRMWTSLAVAAGLLLFWGPYYRSLTEL